MKIQNREIEIDILKGIGIILVVMGHLEPGNILLKYIYSFHMFLFFFTSGYLNVKNKDIYILDYVKTNSWRLIIPYMLWELLAQLVELFAGNLQWPKTVEEIFFLRGSCGWNAPIWFLVVLFWVNICGVLLQKCRQFVRVICAIILMTVGFIFASLQIILPFGLHIVPIALLFWILGGGGL